MESIVPTAEYFAKLEALPNTRPPHDDASHYGGRCGFLMLNINETVGTALRRQVVTGLLILAVGALVGAEPAFAANYGPVKQVHFVILAGRYDCEYGDPSSCPRLHDVTVVGDFALASQGDSAWGRQLLFHKKNNHWHFVAASRGDGFNAAELSEHGVSPSVAVSLAGNNADSRNAALPMRVEKHCIHSAVKFASTYFRHDPKSGWVILFFGRIADPFQGTLEPALVNRGTPDLSRVRYSDRV